MALTVDHSHILGTLEMCKVVETFSSNAMIFHQLYKRVWPSSQRETLFMSHIREIPSADVSLERLEYEVGNPWLSINYSIDYPGVPVSLLIPNNIGEFQ
jgi:collagen type IV alpha-3-binding protein